jgi:hypothetical protein
MSSRFAARVPAETCAGNFPSPVVRKLRRSVLAISPIEASFQKRRFQPGEPVKQRHFETIGRAFVAGYNAAIELDCIRELAMQLDAVESEFRGFAFEGAAMGLTLLDHIIPGKRQRFSQFLSGAGKPHMYMLHVGAGWALARLPWLRLRLSRSIAQYDCLLRWLVVDGFGFHEGYFYWSEAGEKHRVPKSISNYARRAFDQGLGRCVWFACCGDVSRVCDTVGQFDLARRPDLWSGIGLAAAYAGGHTQADLAALHAVAGEHLPAMAQGAAFAAKARLRAGNPASHTESACAAICGMSSRDAAALTDAALKDLSCDSSDPVFEIWRQRIQREFLTVRR